MNLPNKVTISRLILTVLIIFILLFPFASAGIEVPQLFINEAIVVDIKYIVVAILFMIASLTDFIDGHLARKYNQITNFGKMMDAIADKVLVDSVLIILAATGFISVLVPVIIVTRDIIVDMIKMVAASQGEVVQAIKTGKIKTACMMLGIVLTLFYNLPFELFNLHVSDAFMVIACLMSIVSAVEYFNLNKKYLIEQKPKRAKKEVVEDEVVKKLKEIEQTSKQEKVDKIEII